MKNEILYLMKKDEKLQSIIHELIKDKSKTKNEDYKAVIEHLVSKDITISSEDIDLLLKNNTNDILKNKASDVEFFVYIHNI